MKLTSHWETEFFFFKHLRFMLSFN